MTKIPKPLEPSQPFYGDILARSLLRIRIPKYEAYQITHRIWKKISRSKKDSHEVQKEVEAVLKKNYPKLLKSYRHWIQIMKSPKPTVILIGGGTGIGTSTLAVRMAWLLEINRIVSTDSVREVIRQFLSADVLPIVHVSTYQTGKLIEQVNSAHDRLIYGFLSQSKEVLNGVEAIVKRSIKESASVVIEGIHIVPGEMKFLKKYAKEATIIQVMLDVKQKSKHRLHFFSRRTQSANRSKTEYLKHFDDIRLIRDFLVEQAEKNHVSVIQNYDMHKVEQELLQKIYHAHPNKK